MTIWISYISFSFFKKKQLENRFSFRHSLFIDIFFSLLFKLYILLTYSLTHLFNLSLFSLFPLHGSTALSSTSRFLSLHWLTAQKYRGFMAVCSYCWLLILLNGFEPTFISANFFHFVWISCVLIDWSLCLFGAMLSEFFWNWMRGSIFPAHSWDWMIDFGCCEFFVHMLEQIKELFSFLPYPVQKRKLNLL